MKNRLLIAALFAAVGFANLSISGQALAQAADVEAQDAALVDKVKAALAAHPELHANHLKVASKNSEVTLSGKVGDSSNLMAIAREVQKVPGVKYVNNDMMPNDM